MKGTRPIRTVEDLLMYLHACPLNAEITLMPEDGDGFNIGGVLELNAERPPKVWLLIDEFGELIEDTPDEQTMVERPGDMSVIIEEPKPEPKTDVVRIRGKLRSA